MNNDFKILSSFHPYEFSVSPWLIFALAGYQPAPAKAGGDAALFRAFFPDGAEGEFRSAAGGAEVRAFLHGIDGVVRKQFADAAFVGRDDAKIGAAFPAVHASLACVAALRARLHQRRQLFLHK